MASGYVIDFNNRSFQDFIYTSSKKDILSDKYASKGTSKANRLREFWDTENDIIVGKLLSELLEYWQTYKLTKQESVNPHEKALFDECQKVTDRLAGKQAAASAPPLTEDEFIRREFKSSSLNKIGLDAGIIVVLEQRLAEINKCLTGKAPLAAIFLCGSTLEGILLGVASQKPKEFNTAAASPKDKTTSQVLAFPRWALANFIDVACELRLLGEDVKKFSHALRDFRNYIHPYQQMASQFNPDQHTAEICWKVLQAAISQLSK